jgi:ribosomal protein S12 methylthiotransferase
VPTAARVHIHTLGCPKNDADSAGLSRRLHAHGISLAARPEQATHVLLNTCGFIEDAKKESIAAILEAVGAFPDKQVLAMGCLVQRYREELAQGIPEVSGWYGLGDTDRLLADLKAVGDAARVPGGATGPAVLGGESGPAEEDAGWATTDLGNRRAFAFVKISDGCDHRCSFCAIPGIKGPYAPMPLSAVLEQTETALALGAREIVLVGQDTAVWRHGGSDLVDLLDRLVGYDEVARVRLLYLQPEHVSEGLLEYMAGQSRMCRYLDIPFQHASRGVLRAMRRAGDAQSYLALLERARAHMPDVSLRSTFIVGFPGETDEEFEELLDFVEAAGLHHAGAFAYSPEEGTPAADLRPRVPARLIRERLGTLSDRILSCSETALGEWVGRRVEVLVEGPAALDGEEGVQAVGRTEGQAPDIDGVAFLTGGAAAGARPGDLVQGQVEDLLGLDLVVEADDA